MSRMIGGAVALLTPALFATTLDAPSAAVLVAVAVALAAVVALSNHVMTSVIGALAPPPRTPDQAPKLLAGRVTDPLHHPLRPRAPGLA
jgi:hypothetical protein